jgi:hypothetical protein
MKRRTIIADRTTADEKMKMWAKRAAAAREQGREVDASRCADKARDWASKVRAMDKNDTNKDAVIAER